MRISGYWTLVSDPYTNKVIKQVEQWCPKIHNQAEANWDGEIN